MEKRGLGPRLATARIRRSLTQDELAERAGLSKDVVCKLEQGQRDGARLSSLFAIAEALGMTVKIEDDDVREQNPELLLPLRRLLRNVILPESTVDEADLTYARLRQRLDDLTEDFSRGHYTQVSREIPVLVRAIETAVTLHENEAKAELSRLLAHAYILTAQTLIMLRSEDLACEAIRKGMDAADDAGDPILRAIAANHYTWVFKRQGMFADMEAIAVTTAEQIGEPSIARARTDHLVAWGRLMGSASMAAVRNNRLEAANEFLAFSHSVAIRLDSGRDAHDSHRAEWMTHTTALVDITRVEMALITGDAPLALRLAKDFRRASDLRTDLRSSFLRRMADAHFAVGDYPSAIETLKSIRPLAPEWLRNQRLAHDAVLRLLDAVPVRRARSSGLSDLAAFMGVQP